jgi:hypothetical protein
MWTGCARLDYTDDQIAGLKHASAASQALFAELADQTRHCDGASLRIAHCIRDLAYGDDSRTDDLTDMVASDDPAYREIFERCYWRPTEEERQREEEDRKQAEAAEPSPTRTRKKPRTTRSR